MDPRPSCGSPREDGELEDGEICDDEAEEKQPQQPKKPQGARPLTGSRKPKTSTPRSKPPGMGPGKDFRSPPPPLFRPGPMLHGTFPVCPSGPDRLEPPSPRTSFWERSHGALGRLRYRGRPGDNRGGRARGAAGRGRNIHRKDSPNWKQKQGGRGPPRKLAYVSPRPENGMDESFEDLLMKYKQIQLELECIRNQERRALKPGDAPEREDTPVGEALTGGAESNLAEKREELEEKKAFQAFNLRPLRQKLLTPAERDALNTKTTRGAELGEAGLNEEVKKEAGKSPVEPTTSNEEEEEDSSDVSISLSRETNKARGKDEDDELSELQLRLLALQSASRRWQQKEQQVMKESKEKLNRAKTTPEHYRVTTRSASAGRGRPASGLKGPEKGKPPGRLGTERNKAAPKGHLAKHTLSPVTKQAWRKQQLHTWKMQQEAQKQKSEEDEEKKKREEEIRKIRDLSNQEEQYNRFMKLVGGKHHTHIKFTDPEYRKLMLKQGLDSLGNLYQYDNYDEVAMDTDSETNSPAASPAHEPFLGVGSLFAVPMSMFSLGSASLRQDPSQYCVDPVGVVSLTPPPPPPPMPPPEEESERPPKPPFADEEEEEEMMLREELLKSLANKRAVRAEDASSTSGPPSPIRPVAPPTIRAPPTASSTSLGFSASSSHSSRKFARGAGASRAPLVLPRHKAVVVRLNASDDSDSEMEASSSTQCVFGGLESMIKEARRTVEAAKPRPVPVSEKENNPLRTPDTLPEGTAMEYRLLRAELTSRENQRVRSSDSAVSSPAGFDADVDVDVLGDVEEKLAKHRAQMQKDQVLLEQLHQQELRKKESLKLAEAKVVRLKEQMLAAEKVASANRVLLRKLQEQVQRVRHRVVVKQHQAMRMERELLSNTGIVRGNYKRNNTQLSVGKRAHTDLPDSHYADLMAQKRRLQQLESEYALKIQKLKEAQALRQAGAPVVPCGVTQPSLHDLTQDKLTLASDDPGDADDPEGAEPQPPDSSANTSVRRRSFRESGSFTKPNLSHGETPATPTTPTAPNASSKQATPPAELLLFGLNVEDLRLRYQRCETLPDLLTQELRSQGGALLDSHPNDRIIQVDFDPMAPQQIRSELKPVPFGPYRSPLLVFRSYRFSPYFRTKEKLSLSSVTYSHAIEPRKCFCRFDLTGTCNDDDCQWQHMRNCTLNGNQLFQDILSYSLPLIGCSDQSSTNDITRSTEKYIKKLFGANKDRMVSDQKAVLLVSKVNESLRHVPPFTTSKQRRKWRPEPHRTSPDPHTAAESEEENITIPPPPAAAEEDVCVSECRLASDVCVTQDDKRYFDSETDDISNLEYSVLDSPRDRQLWIKLAYRYLNQKDTAVSECVDAALNTLSRALEDNREDEELWCHYLTLFSRRGNTDDVREMCDMAVEHAAHYTVWWTYLSIESSFDGKDAVCKRMLQFLVDAAEGAVGELSSFHLLEALLYRAQLSVFTGRLNNARHILEGALTSEGDACLVSKRLAVSHRCLAWLSYIHLCEFGTLPAHLYDPANSNPSRLVSLETFVFPWRTSEDVHTPPERLVTLFQDAISKCVDEGVSPAEHTLACLPLHLNLLHLHRVLGRLKEAIALCENMLVVVPHCCPLLETMGELHAAGGDAEEAGSVWLRAHRLRPHDAQVFYNLCKCLHVQEKHSELEVHFKQFVCSLVDGVVEDLPPVVVFRHLLGVPTEDLRLPVPSLPEHLQDQLPYLHLTHSFWQSVRGTVVEAVEAFEAALGAISDLKVVKKLWLDYLLFTSSKLAGRDLRVFSDLVQRCLNTTPCRISLPHHSATYWTCYSFHNQVISFYLSFLPPSLHSSALERFRHTMPNNTELCLRVLQQEWTDENVEHMKLQTRLMTTAVPTCLSAWRIAVAVQKQQKCRVEVQKLYQQALQKLPLCADLWREWLLFEAAAGGKTDTLNKLVAKCQDVGASLSEPLSVHSHTQDS